MSSYRQPYAGIVGNGRTCALIDARGIVGWMCIPTFAHFPVFAGLLDPRHGGRLELGIESPRGIVWASERGEFAQRYLPATNVLETTWTVDGCSVVVRDAMPRDETTLLRETNVVGKECPAHLLVRMRPTFPTTLSTRLTVTQEGIRIQDTRCKAEGWLICRGTPEGRVAQVTAGEIIYQFPLSENALLLMISYKDGASARTKRPVAPRGAVQACQESDERWLSQAVRLALPDGELTETFQRSLLALRLLIYEPTGAMLAAATASFPSKKGGDRNWDYRYCWVRDGCYAAQALDLAGFPEEAERLYEFLLERETNGQWVSPLWSIDVGYPADEEQVEGLAGPNGETPIRIGNQAALQDQHDSPGHVLSGINRHSVLTGKDDLAIRHWERVVRAAEWCCDHWADSEAGIWEKRDRQRPWVHGRALCWVALREALALGQRLSRPIPRRWQQAMDEIRDSIRRTGWSDEKGAYVRAGESDPSYDISVLALVLDNLFPPEDQRIRQTVLSLAHHLAYGTVFQREERDTRTAFYLASFWVIRALQRIGEYDEAFAHLRATIGGATELGLMAEYFDPSTGRQHGNIPQAFSHEELIKTVAEMLWRLDGERLLLFPAIPSHWLVPGIRLSVSNLPVAGNRAVIGLNIKKDLLDFVASKVDRFEPTIPQRYLAGNWRVRLNGEWRP